jgi:Protein of unknown function (DUF2934)
VTIKTEFASVEENDGSIRKAIERRAYELYERDGFKEGSDQEAAVPMQAHPARFGQRRYPRRRKRCLKNIR